MKSVLYLLGKVWSKELTSKVNVILALNTVVKNNVLLRSYA